MAEPHRFTMTWAPGHVDILGNERADQEAKAAAQQTDVLTEPKDLPKILKALWGRLPINKSAAKQHYRKATKKRWAEECANKHRFRRIHAIDPTAPLNQFMKLMEDCTRGQSSILIQLRTGKAPLNRHLYQMKRIDRPTCPHCPTTEETVKHYLLECRHYWREQWEMRKEMGRRGYRLSNMLGNKQHKGAVLRYISATGRFKRTKENGMGGGNPNSIS
jgi:hypothetical protein